MAVTTEKVLESREVCKSGVPEKIYLRASSKSVKEIEMEMETSIQAKIIPRT